MTFSDFVREFASVVQFFGEEHFPKIVLERIHYKTKDLPRTQFLELRNLILDQCEFAPKVPKIVELSNIVRARNKPNGIPEAEDLRSGLTEHERRQKMDEIRNILSNVGLNPKETA